MFKKHWVRLIHKSFLTRISKTFSGQTSSLFHFSAPKLLLSAYFMTLWLPYLTAYVMPNPGEKSSICATINNSLTYFPSHVSKFTLMSCLAHLCDIVQSGLLSCCYTLTVTLTFVVGSCPARCHFQ